MTFTLGLVTLAVGLTTFVAAVVHTLRESRSPAASPTSEWRVVVEPATRYCDDYMGGYDRVRVEGEVAVALRRGRGERMPIEVLRVTADDFETRLEKAELKAEDRAAVLNARGMV